MNATKTRSLFKLAAVLATSLLAQGCVGIVSRGMERQTLEPAMVAAAPAIHSVSGTQTKDKTENPTALWLEKNWGQPSHLKRLTQPEQSELWTYNFEHRWCGAMPCIIVPIPLLLPVGRERVVFHIREGRVAKAEVTTLGGYQLVAGLGPEGPFSDCGHWH